MNGQWRVYQNSNTVRQDSGWSIEAPPWRKFFPLPEDGRFAVTDHPEEIPDPQDPETFLRSKLDWNELSREPHAALLDWYRSLISFRGSTPALTDGRLDKLHVHFDERKNWLTFSRGAIAVACNLAMSKQTIPLPFVAMPLLCSEPQCDVHAQGITLPPDSVAILARSTLNCPTPKNILTASTSPTMI